MFFKTCRFVRAALETRGAVYFRRFIRKQRQRRRFKRGHGVRGISDAGRRGIDERGSKDHYRQCTSGWILVVQQDDHAISCRRDERQRGSGEFQRHGRSGHGHGCRTRARNKRVENVVGAGREKYCGVQSEN